MQKLITPFAFLLTAITVHAQKIMDFTDANAPKQTDWEKQYDAQLKASNQDEYMKFLTSHPHHVGSPQDFTAIVKDVDIVSDLVGGEAQTRSFEVLKTGGKLISTVTLLPLSWLKNIKWQHSSSCPIHLIKN